MKSLNQKSLFLNLFFFNMFHNFLDFNHAYYFYLLEHFSIKLDLSNRLKAYLPYIDITKNYQSNKLKQLVDIKNELLEHEIIDSSLLDCFEGKTIYTINQMPIASFIKAKEVINLPLEKQSLNPIKLYKTDSYLEASYCVYELVIQLLRDRVSINDIVILNSSSEDDYNLLKIFSDAFVPVTINKSVKLNSYPEVIKLQRILQNEGFIASKNYLNNLVKSKKDGIYLSSLIQIYNNYLDKDLEKNPDVLMAILNNHTISQKRYTDCINVYPIDDFSYSPEKHYILMNYSDNSLPKTATNSHYLSKEDLKEIDYLEDTLLNEYYHLYYSNLIRNIEHLSLVFTNFTEEENRIATLDLKREITEEDYQYIVKDFTYLNALTQLEFAKTNYDFKTFFLRHQNYNNLYFDFHRLIKNYSHDFTGIQRSDLFALLKKNPSITAYKLETYMDCQFQFLLKNLLKLEPFETSISQYLGTLTHKVLEAFTLDTSVDYYKLVDEDKDFPEEFHYKEQVFKTAIKKELDVLLKIIGDFHQQTAFKKILLEYPFRFPFKHDQDFEISGIIDKVMIRVGEDLREYVVLIDYKLGDKDFSLDKFEKDQQLQLPLYLYAYQNLNDSKVIPVGFFYQKTSIGRYNFEAEAVLKNYRMKGVALEDKEILSSFNPELENLEGISITSKGKLSSRSRLVTDSGFTEIYDSIEEKIIEMIRSLKLGEFAINPSPAYGSRKDSKSCEYCSFAGICYNKNRKAEVKE
ncbi:MAG: PD-(D/E)XK nuclease family protein [Tenericutes bacterium]|nr:PD-(D/E)XK nuclease family protein [Mycoplasmatota bacterium]